MPTDFKLPELGENISAGDVMRVLVKAGDSVANDQAVLELETDKATIEVPSSVAGTVTDVKVKPGEKVKVGQVIFSVDEAGGGAGKPAAAKGEQADPAKGSDKPKPEPAGAAEEGGISQQATPERGEPGGGREEAADNRQSDKPGIAEGPRAQRTVPRLP